MVIGLLRIGIGIYRLELRRSMREMLSDIYYRMNFYDVSASGGILITSKIAVQVDVNATRDHFWLGGAFRAD
jgi:hypothetical protein